MSRHPTFPTHPIPDEAHDHGLAETLSRITARLPMRRRTLNFLAAGAGSALLMSACGSGSNDAGTSTASASDASSGTTSTTSGTTSTTSGTTSTTSGTTSTTSGTTSTTSGTTATTSGTTATTTGTGSTTSSSSGTSTETTSSSCSVASTEETAGPYPGDGTNTSSGSTSDILTASGIVRSDIRSSFLLSTTTAPGVRVDITLTLVNQNSSCAALSGYAIYLWHCTAAGHYSLYTDPNESYLRGVQVTDSNGQVTFTTILPACYSGRWPHMHLEVFSSLASATNGRNAVLTSQLAMPVDVCNTVYSASSDYSGSTSNLAQITLATDNVFGDNTSAELALETPVFTGSVANGYTATAQLVVAV